MDSKLQHSVTSTCTWFTSQKMDMRFIIALLSIFLYFLSFLSMNQYRISKSLHIWKKNLHDISQFHMYNRWQRAPMLLATTFHPLKALTKREKRLITLITTWDTWGISSERDMHAWRERTDVCGRSGPNRSVPLSLPDTAEPFHARPDTYIVTDRAKT